MVKCKDCVYMTGHDDAHVSCGITLKKVGQPDKEKNCSDFHLRI